MASKKKNAPVPVERSNQTSVQSKTGVVAVYPTANPGSRADAIDKARERDRLEKLRAPWARTPPSRRARLLALLKSNPGSETDTQVARVLSALEGGMFTSNEARLYLDVVHPAGRIKTLRDRGFIIDTRWVVQPSTCGKPHRYGLYILIHVPVEAV